MWFAHLNIFESCYNEAVSLIDAHKRKQEWGSCKIEETKVFH